MSQLNYFDRLTTLTLNENSPHASSSLHIENCLRQYKFLKHKSYIKSTSLLSTQGCEGLIPIWKIFLRNEIAACRVGQIMRLPCRKRACHVLVLTELRRQRTILDGS